MLVKHCDRPTNPLGGYGQILSETVHPVWQRNRARSICCLFTFTVDPQFIKPSMDWKIH